MEQVSELMRDQMNQPLDRAVYWIEYVIRHQGAPHLRTASRKLSLYQRGLLDVTFLVLFFCLLSAYVLYRLCRSVVCSMIVQSGMTRESPVASRPIRRKHKTKSA